MNGTNKVKEAFRYRKAKSLEVKKLFFNVSKKENNGSKGRPNIDEENNFRGKFKKILTKGRLNSCSAVEFNVNENEKIEELKEKLNKASYLDPSKIIF